MLFEERQRYIQKDIKSVLATKDEILLILNNSAKMASIYALSAFSVFIGSTGKKNVQHKTHKTRYDATQKYC